MPKNLFKYIINKKYKDEIPLLLLFSNKIDYLFNENKISEENVLDLIDFFKEKMKISDVTTIAKLLKDAEDLDSINKLLDEFPPHYFYVEDWEEVNNEDIENEYDVTITENNNLSKEKTVPISVFSEQNDDSGIYLDVSLSSSQLMRSSITPRL